MNLTPTQFALGESLDRANEHYHVIFAEMIRLRDLTNPTEADVRKADALAEDLGRIARHCQ